MQKSTLLWVAGISACAPMLAIAQPAEPSRQVTPLPYTSAFANYTPFQELEPGNWRALNDAVGAAAAKPGSQSSPTAPIAAPAGATNNGMRPPDMKTMPGMNHPMHGGKP